MRGSPGEGYPGGAAPSAFGGTVRTLLDNIADMVTVSDPDGRIVYANAATESVSGYAPEEFAARNPFDSMHPEDRPRCEEAFERLAKTPGLSLALEHRVRRKDGAWRWVGGTFVSLFEDPEVGGLVSVLRDITERKRTEERLRFQARVLGAVGEAVVAVDADGRVSYWNRAAEGAFGRSAEEALGRRLGEMVASEDLHGRAEGIMAGVREGGSWTGEFVVRRKDGSAFAAQATNTPVFGEDGGLTGAICVFTDVTESKRAGEALRESEERYRLAADAAGLGRWQFVPETAELVGDDAFNGHHGAPPGAHLGFEGLLEAVHPDGRGVIRRRVAAAVEERDGYEAVYRVVLPDGSIRWIHSRGRFAAGAGSAPDRLVGVTLDVTARRELERERERARARKLTARVEEAERERISRELHDRVAHNMGVAHQSLQLHAFYASTDPSRAAEKLEQAAEATKTALDQTRDLSAQLARSDAQETLHGLGPALRDLLATHAPPGVETALSVTGDESSVPTGVGEQAYLVIREAVRNAVAHSGCGRIEVSLEVRGGELRGRVEDDGAGFDPHGEPDGWREGGRSAAADGEGASRAGVGLGSMRERAELLGGRLDISSEPGRGTAVEMRAPLEA